MKKLLLILLILFTLIFTSCTVQKTDRTLPESKFNEFLTLNKTNKKYIFAGFDFEDNENIKSIYESEFLESLIKNNYEVFDRKNLRDILSEHKLQLSGITNDETIKQAGTLTGADVLIKGDISVFNTGEMLSIYFIDIKTSKILCFKSFLLPIEHYDNKVIKVDNTQSLEKYNKINLKVSLDKSSFETLKKTLDLLKKILYKKYESKVFFKPRYEKDSILIEINYNNKLNEKDLLKTIKILESKPKVSFGIGKFVNKRPIYHTSIKLNNRKIPLDFKLLERIYVKKENNKDVVFLSFNKIGEGIMKKLTSKNIGNYFFVLLNNEIMFKTVINTRLGKSVIISNLPEEKILYFKFYYLLNDLNILKIEKI